MLYPDSPVLSILGEDNSLISYRPKLVEVTGSINAAILFQQILFRWGQVGRKPFYKFNQPSTHVDYREGDSFQEELGFSRAEFETARKKIGARIKAGEWKNIGNLDQRLIYYWRDSNNKMWYGLNEAHAEAVLTEYYSKKSEFSLRMLESSIPECGNPALQECENPALPVTEITRDNQRQQSSGLSDVGDETGYEDDLYTEEPRYSNNKFEEDEEMAGSKYKWQTPRSALAIRALEACGRKYYAKKEERTKWRMIEKAMMPLSSEITSEYPSEWVEELIAWAEKSNLNYRKSHPGRYGVKIRFGSLLYAIMNEGRKLDWISKAEKNIVVNNLDDDGPIGQDAQTVSDEDFYGVFGQDNHISEDEDEIVFTR